MRVLLAGLFFLAVLVMVWILMPGALAEMGEMAGCSR